MTKKTIEECFYDLNKIQMMMPLHVQNYTDFYSSIEHATNVGKMFPQPENAIASGELVYQWLSRSAASSIGFRRIVSQTKGQMKPADAENHFRCFKTIRF